jgi:hypothetical protein
MSFPLPPEPLPPLPTAGVVVYDTPCRGCAYNLVGLDLTGACPECGAPIVWATLGNQLRFSDPDWLRRIRRGAATIVGGILASAATVFCTVGAVFNNIHMGLPTPLIAMLAGWATWILGSAWLTSPDPSPAGEEINRSARRAARAMLVPAAFGALWPFAGFFVLPQAAMYVVGCFGPICTLLTFAVPFLQARYLERLLLRIPDYALSERARGFNKNLGIATGGLAVIGIFITLVSRFQLAACGMGLILLPAAVLAFGYLRLLLAVRERLAPVVVEAQRNCDAGLRADNTPPREPGRLGPDIP